MTTAQRNALIALGLFFITLIGGYAWGYKIKGSSSVKLYVFKSVDKNGKLANGFACKCYKDGASNETSWRGRSEINCGPGIYPDRVIELNLVNEGNVPPPAGACCRDKPKIGNVVLINKSDLNCF